MKYKCKFCPYETDNHHAIAGHTAGHKRRARAIVADIEVPIGDIFLKPEDIADALLERVVKAITNYDNILTELGELKGYKTRVDELEKELREEKAEKERILKIHNEQVKRKKLTDTETLKKLARL